MSKKSTSKLKHSYTIGFDLGGTKLAAALVRSDGKILDFIKVPVNLHKTASAKKSQTQVIQLMADLAMDFKARYPDFCVSSVFRGVGLASAGPLNVETGCLINPANFRGWKTVPIKKLLQQELQNRRFRTHVYFQNDAMAAALAEGWVGAAKQNRSYAVVTVGTGIGSGLILNGQPCQSRGAGSEFGHILVDLSSLKKDLSQRSQFSVEGYASGTALLHRARQLGFKGSSVEELVLENNPRYQELYNDMALALAILCYNLSIGFNLDAIYLSGGLIKIKKLYFNKMRTYYRQLVRQFNPQFECSLSIAKTQNQAGILGAAYLPHLK
ncbi:ROK family protein [Pseudobdellovibrio exovorus]|uniref:Glucokinase n=1 Tax=Pseudobdellovibrio exovorus JSS TaxID=1184267 RepID=M4V928_9BACT|nr:ROK family protein [Pseudobdellovibrio exovorus]AGH94506.1 hypothetical protein A11Q_286 [Pseudobdellovibrio exovorus JSS]